jgi:hypothetical protein
MSGVTPQGFVLKTIEEIKLDIETDELATIDPTLVLSADQPIGEINAAVSKQLAEVWEVAQIAYNAFDRDASEDRLLDNLGSLTGTPRSRAKKSVVTCTVTLGAAFSQPAGLMMCDVVGQPAIKFVNRDPVVSTTAGTYTAIFESVDHGVDRGNESRRRCPRRAGREGRTVSPAPGRRAHRGRCEHGRRHPRGPAQGPGGAAGVRLRERDAGDGQ